MGKETAVLNPMTSLLVTICFSTLHCTSIMSIFRASSICKPRPCHTSSLTQLLCPVINWTDVAYIPMPRNPLHFSWLTRLLRIKAVDFFQHIRNCSPTMQHHIPQDSNTYPDLIPYSIIVETDTNVYACH